VATATGGLSRVTIVAPTTRVDLALPSDVPFADMLPTLLRYAGDGLADDPSARAGWTLSRLGGVVLDSSRSPRELEVRDGELLYLRPRSAETPELAFDDVVDAVATATRERAGRWQPGVTRAVGLTVAVVALLGGATAVLFAGPPQFLAGVVALAVSLALLVLAAVMSRAFGQSPTGVVFALVALVYAAVGGLLIGAGDLEVTNLSAPHLLLAAATLLVATALATVAVGDSGPVFLTAAVSVGALIIATGVILATGATTAAGAAVVAAFTFAWLPALPMLAYRLARMPIPSVPTGPEDLKTDTETVDGERILKQSDRADEYLAALLGALAVIGTGSGLVLATSGMAGVLLATVLGALMVARARWFINRRQRLPLLVAGLITLGGAVTAVYLSSDVMSRLVAIPGILAIVAIAGFVAAAVQRRRSPRMGRLLDILEVLLIVAIIPLACWASGLYGWVRSLGA
jgi:type VII secretion integral membrane protein EccD